MDTPRKQSIKPNTSISASTGENEEVNLVRQLGIFSYTVLIVGTAIGSGIFISPKGVLEYTHTVGLSMVVWILCGVLSTFGALSYGELGTTFSKSGGDFIYLLESFGPMTAFLRVWTCLVAVITGSYAVLGITSATYILTPFYPDCPVPDLAVRFLAAAIVCAIFFVNCVSVPLSSHLNVLFTFVKVAGLVVIVVAGIVLLIQGNTENFENAFQGDGDFKWIELPLSFYSGLFAYAGWEITASMTEELIKPSRTIPVSTLIAMTIVSFVFIMANVAYFTVLTPAEIMASDAVALSFGQKVFGNSGWILSVVVAFSCIGAMNGGVLSTSRMNYAASREGQLPKLVSMIHINYKTPMPSAVIMLPISIILLVGDSVYSLINYLSFTRWLFAALTVASVPYFRWKYPDWERPFKVDTRERHH
ncbi:cystine/glutamate transporter-like isoform X2 [Anneissia japonica]|uniref:cystine/glutamate transporter-like isoform X2 n=1 Tax=Anneissia japonica TaxID=1529436 RepID=UPI0014254DC6|nr:cystine/glutamate transporter-like isoform X2 [Anneissia japonica]